MAKQNDITPSDFKFEFDGVAYEFTALKFRLKMTDGKPSNDGILTEVSAEEAAEDAVICAHLVDIKSGLINEVETEASDSVSDLKVPELKKILIDAGVEFNLKATKAELVVLVEALKEGGE